MNIVHPEYFEEISVSEDEPYTLIIENGKVYRRAVIELYRQSVTDEGGYITSIGNELVSFSKNCAVITDVFNVDVNERKILGKLQNEIVKEYAGSELYYSISELLNQFGIKVCNSSEYSLTFNDNIPLPEIIRLLGIRVNIEYADSLESIIDYFVLCMKLLKKKMFITIGVKDIMDECEFRMFNKMIEYNKIPLLMIERHTHKKIGLTSNSVIL